MFSHNSPLHNVLVLCLHSPSSNQSFKSFRLFRGSNNTCCELVTRPTIFSLISLKPINRQSSMHPFRAKFLTGKTFGNKLQPNILNSESAPCEQEFRKMIFLVLTPDFTKLLPRPKGNLHTLQALIVLSYLALVEKKI